MYYAKIEDFVLLIKNILEEEYQTKIMVSEIIEKSSDPNDYDPELECWYENIIIKYTDFYNDELLDEINIPIDVFSDDLEDVDSCSSLIDHYMYNLNMFSSNYNNSIYNCLKQAVEMFRKSDDDYELLTTDDYVEIKKIYKRLKKCLVKKMN